MNKEDIFLLAQLLNSLRNELIKLEKAIDMRDVEMAESIKMEILRNQSQIKRLL